MLFGNFVCVSFMRALEIKLSLSLHCEAEELQCAVELSSWAPWRICRGEGTRPPFLLLLKSTRFPHFSHCTKTSILVYNSLLFSLLLCLSVHVHLTVCFYRAISNFLFCALLNRMDLLPRIIFICNFTHLKLSLLFWHLL